MIHVVAYATNPPRATPGFIKALSKHSCRWQKLMRGAWRLDTKHSAGELSGLLSPHIQHDDTLFVIRSRDEHGGWLTKEARNWITASHEHKRFG